MYGGFVVEDVHNMFIIMMTCESGAVSVPCFLLYVYAFVYRTER